VALRVLDADLRVLPMRTRMPFRYGIATLRALPHLFVRLSVEIDGVRATGIAADGLAPKWFTKNPATSTEQDIGEMFAVIEQACAFARAAAPAPTVFDLWRAIDRAQRAWGDTQGYPPLLSGFGTSLVERALIEAFCTARDTTFGAAVRDDSLGLRLGATHLALEGRRPADFLPPEPLATLRVRHTVGLGDPITDDDIAPDERVADGFPQSLVACVRRYGLTHFKIKLGGDGERDGARLRQIAAVLGAEAPAYVFTLDGNEQFHDVEHFRTAWRALHADPALRDMLERLLFVEQPLHRDVALSRATATALQGWHDRPPIIIDESDGSMESLPMALAAGYVGTSHKNCKGVFKGIANRCLIEHLRRADPARHFIMSGEDLANVGPVALLQDLAAMATLGIEHVERNGHHYFAGLSMFGADVQEQVLGHHGDLYERTNDGTATLRIEDGTIAITSVVGAPFGLGFPFDSTPYQTATRAAIGASP
jgi:hypothetical protein